jgi:hypothetical protein
MALSIVVHSFEYGLSIASSASVGEFCADATAGLGV